MGAKNNDSHSCMGASAFLKSVDFRAFEINVKTIAPTQKIVSIWTRNMIEDKSKDYYVFLDEIQKVVTIQNPYIEGVEDKIGFVDVVLGLMKYENIDVYVCL